jgi:transaldolase/glucose-6-phosphate isomerase
MLQRQMGNLPLTRSDNQYELLRLHWLLDIALLVFFRDDAIVYYEHAGGMGKMAIANAQAAYGHFWALMASERWLALAAQGARPQRVLWASTSVKNPAYPDTLCVDTLIGPDTVNTVRPATLDAYLDHGLVAQTLYADPSEGQGLLGRLDDLGIDLDQVLERLLREGVAAFVRAFESLHASIAR